jgi:import inner membrane translocase subunit TIM44
VRERERQLYYVREGYEMGPNGLPISKKPLGEDLNAGTALAIHESENSKGVWQKFKQESELGQRLFGYSRKIDETDSPLYERLRGFKDMTSINESETAKVIRTFRRLDTKFSQYDFLKFATKYIVPDIIDGFLMKDKNLIDLYCGEKVALTNLGSSNYQS